MKSLIIKNVIILTPFHDLGLGSILIEEGKIKAIEKGTVDVEGAEIIDASGNFISPGFIDLHTHGAGNHDFMEIGRAHV